MRPAAQGHRTARRAFSFMSRAAPWPGCRRRSPRPGRPVPRRRRLSSPRATAAHVSGVQDQPGVGLPGSGPVAVDGTVLGADVQMELPFLQADFDELPRPPARAAAAGRTSGRAPRRWAGAPRVRPRPTPPAPGARAATRARGGEFVHVRRAGRRQPAPGREAVALHVLQPRGEYVRADAGQVGVQVGVAARDRPAAPGRSAGSSGRRRRRAHGRRSSTGRSFGEVACDAV